MAEQLAALRPPSVAPGDITRLEREAKRIGQGFDVSPLRFPHLVAADGRQDFPHFWIYPLANVPALWLTHAVDVHPNWAFTLTNCVLVAVAFYTVSRHVSIVWAVLLLGGPLIWWIDKAHGDLFTASLLATGCALWRGAPGWTLVLVGIAAAQNPALMPVWLLIAGVASIKVLRAREVGGEGRGVGAGVAIGVAIGGAIIALPLAYYMTRLRVWSPLIGYTHPGAPSMRAMASLVGDANVGLVANAPLFLAAVLVALTLRLPRPAAPRQPTQPTQLAQPAQSSWPEYAIVIGAWGILLAGYAQSVNLNHGATPGINRWTLWLMPWLLLIVPPRGQAAVGTARRTILPLLAALHVAWAICLFRPGLPEVYRYPSWLASWLWTHAPGWYAPAPEIFAERVSHREPPVLPIAWHGCTIVLLIDGQWPLSCLPAADTPAICREPDRLCYAIRSPARWGNAADGRTTFVDLGKASFPNVVAAERWTADAPFMAALRTRVATALERDPALRGDAAASAVVRATQHVSRTYVWKGRSILLIYAGNVRSDASLRLRVDADYHGALIDLETNQQVADIAAARSGEHPTDLPLPGAVDHALIWLEANTPVSQ